MPPWVSDLWLKECGCAGKNFGVIPIPFVRMPPDYEPDGEPGRYGLEWLGVSQVSTLPSGR